MAQKIADLAVCVSVYPDRATGEQKKRFKQVGAVLQMDDGGEMMVLDTTFNPAGAYNPDGRERVPLYRFAPRDDNQPRSSAQGQPRQQRAAPPPPAHDDGDDIPF